MTVWDQEKAVPKPKSLADAETGVKVVETRVIVPV